jgi:hypothetical protein
MRGARFKQEQIIAILREAKTGGWRDEHLCNNQPIHKEQKFNSHTNEFAIPTNDTTELIRAAISSIGKLYRRGVTSSKSAA